MPRVSVVVPTYNRAHCLLRAIRSVLAQDFNDWDLTVVDDGSTDNTAAVMNAIAEVVGPRCRRVFQQQSGASGARNTGIAQTDSEWIAFLDSDDLWLPEKLGRQLHVADAASAAFVYSDHFEFTDRKGVTRHQHAIPADMTSRIYPQLLEVRCNVITCPSVLIRRAVLSEVGGFDESMKICEDIDLWRRAARGRRVEVVSSPLVGVHIREGGPFPYVSSLRGRMALYAKAVAQDVELEALVPQWYLELLQTYREVAAHRGEGAVRSALDSACKAIAKPQIDASACHAAVSKAIDTIDALGVRALKVAG